MGIDGVIARVVARDLVGGAGALRDRRFVSIFFCCQRLLIRLLRREQFDVAIRVAEREMMVG